MIFAPLVQLGQTIGVIGVTRTPRKAPGFDEMMPSSRLHDAAAMADHLINVLPASADNIGLFDARVFAAMKPTAYYINAGRGQTVDEAALLAALRERRIAGAGLDVFGDEPLPPESPFWALPNVFITPHVGGYIVEYEDFVMPLTFYWRLLLGLSIIGIVLVFPRGMVGGVDDARALWARFSSAQRKRAAA